VTNPSEKRDADALGLVAVEHPGGAEALRRRDQDGVIWDVASTPSPIRRGAPAHTMIDQLVLQRARHGDETALRSLWVQHGPHIDAVIRRLCGDADLAADIAQEVWMQIFRALPGYRGDAQFSTWAHRIAVNRTLNALRKIRHLQRAEVDMPVDVAAPEVDVDRSFVAESIAAAVSRLSPGARAVFVLHDVEGYTHEEIAKELGITSGGSKSQLFKARAKLRRLLAHLVDDSVPAMDRSHVAPAC
jgi:RNA polymerase sigma-70 factor (ECF subfamily)